MSYLHCLSEQETELIIKSSRYRMPPQKSKIYRVSGVA